MGKHIYDTEKSFQTGKTDRELPTGNEYLFHQQSTGSESDMTATESAYSKDPLKKLTIRLKKIRGKKESYIQHSESEEPGMLETYGEDYNSAKISGSLHGKNKNKLVADTILSGDQDATCHVCCILPHT
uniref:MBF1 domain-containing protein n=1 Tax=Heterorhabditis bacteriophora TaxID=37862 RepID=A0A1I7XQ21_HETBA